eukprot:PRCOL_00002787-RA
MATAGLGGGGGEQLTDAGVDGKDAAGEVAPKKKKETQPRRRQRAFYEDAASGMQQLAIPSETNRTDMYSFDVSTTKTGLHRSPVTGGVASASHTHTLPSPAVAVRNLMEQARYGQLCTLMSRSNHRRAGYPFGSVVDFVTDDAGMPIFALSPLAIHTRNLNEDSRATIVVQMPGWHGMANARVTLFGDIYPVDPERTSVARECFRQKHDSPKHHTLYANSGSSFQYFHMHTLHDIYFVGGFGTVTWINCEDYYNATPDQITRDCEATLRMLNDTFRAPMIELFGSSLEHPLDSDHKDQDPDSVNIITIDQRGVDVRLRYGSEYSIRRLCFDRLVDTPEQAAAAMQRITTSSTGEGIGLGGIDVE